MEDCGLGLVFKDLRQFFFLMLGMGDVPFDFIFSDGWLTNHVYLT